MLSIMLFLFFFFLGIVAMFYCFLRRVEQNARLLRDEHAQLRVLMRAMESHLDHMDRLETQRAREDGVDTGAAEGKESTANAAGDGDPGSDPLLHLSFEASPQVEEAAGGLNINFDPAKDDWRKRDEA